MGRSLPRFGGISNFYDVYWIKKWTQTNRKKIRAPLRITRLELSKNADKGLHEVIVVHVRIGALIDVLRADV